jgi:hypothetical protein
MQLDSRPMRTNASQRACLWTVWAAALVAPAAQARPDVADCIAGAERFERRYERIAATIETRAYILQAFDEGDGSIPADRLVRSDSIKFWRDDRTARSLGHITYRRMDRGRVAERVELTECLVTPEQSLLISRDPARAQEGPGVTAQSTGAANDSLLRLLSGVGTFIFAGRIDYLGPGLVERLTAAKPTAAADRLNGRAVERVDFEDAWGVQAVWFDPARDYHPVRVTQRKQPHHWVRPHFRMNQVPDNPRFGRMTEMDLDLVVTGLRQIQGAWYATGFEIRKKNTTSETQPIETKDVTRIVEISPDPRAGGNQFQVTTPVPNGTRVTVDNQTQIRNEWRNGEIVRSVNQPAAETLAQQEYQPPSRWWVWPAILILATGCVAYLVWLRRRLMLRREVP